VIRIRSASMFLLAIVMLAVFTRPLFAADDRPNILVIYTDDHSHRSVSCYPEAWKWVNTPNIDRLAARGVRFAHAFVGTWCMPSRATLLTGHHQFGVESMRMEGQYPGSTYDPEKARFWPKTFRENGYTTCQLGKWHTGTDTGANRDWDFQKVWNRPRYPENSGHYFYDQLIETNGGKPELVKGYSTDNYTNWAEDFIRGENRDPEKPWYLWVCYGAVHGPFTPPHRYRDAYPDAKVPIPKDIFPPRPGKPAYMQKIDFWELGSDGQPQMKGGKFGGRTVANATSIHEFAERLGEAVSPGSTRAGRLSRSAGVGPGRNRRVRQHAHRFYVRPGFRVGAARLQDEARSIRREYPLANDRVHAEQIA
jgi:hypothetical protein